MMSIFHSNHYRTASTNPLRSCRGSSAERILGTTAWRYLIKSCPTFYFSSDVKRWCTRCTQKCTDCQFLANWHGGKHTSPTGVNKFPLVLPTFNVRSGWNSLNPELNPICYLLALLGAHHFLHVSRIRVKLLTLRRLMSYIYGAPILDVSRSHTTTQHSR